jgi:proteic killer suppression protein
MEIAFRDKALKGLSENPKTAQRKLGTASARKLRTRLADLRAAGTVAELVAGRPHPLKGDRAGEFAIDLHGGHRLVFVQDHDPVPIREDGTVDWNSVTNVRVVFIGDYHD